MRSNPYDKTDPALVVVSTLVKTVIRGTSKYATTDASVARRAVAASDAIVKVAILERAESH